MKVKPAKTVNKEEEKEVVFTLGKKQESNLPDQSKRELHKNDAVEEEVLNTERSDVPSERN